MSMTPLPRSSPEAHGVSSRAISAWLDTLAADNLELHSFMLLRSGKVIAEGWWTPYSPERVHRLHSLSKSFTASAIGLLVSDGRLSIDDRVVALFPDAVPAEVGDHLAAMRVRDLLTMRTGHAEDILGAMADTADWVRAFLAQPISNTPGTTFVYSSAASFMLSALVQRLSGQTLLDFLRPRLLAPLGIQATDWFSNPQGINLGGFGLHLTTEALARFGQLYLQEGRWQGQQLLPADWVQAASQAQVPPGEDTKNGDAVSDWAQGYGFQFWRCRHGAYRADGAYGQFCIVMPQQQMVLAITANVAKPQRVLDHVWGHLLAELSDDGPLPDDVAAQDALQSRCAALRLSIPDTVDGWHAAPREQTYTFDANDADLRWARLTAGPEVCQLSLADDRAEYAIDFGLDDWREGRTELWGGEEVILARAGWQASGSLALSILLIEGGFRWTGLLDERESILTVLPPPTMSSEGETLLARNDNTD